MALLSSNVIAELDKRKQLSEAKAMMSSSSSSSGLTRRPLHQQQSIHKVSNATSTTTAAELKQVTIITHDKV